MKTDNYLCMSWQHEVCDLVTKRTERGGSLFDAASRTFMHIWGLWCQKHVSQAGISDYIPQWDVITYPCLRYLLLAPKSSYVNVPVFILFENIFLKVKSILWISSSTVVLIKFLPYSGATAQTRSAALWGVSGTTGRLPLSRVWAVWYGKRRTSGCTRPHPQACNPF